ncbi:hypothetical protein [Evansella halocellulosilytica]|uniref:hypothetical protein n=1 Tax=Evansella halocellulosilytica TaxID=2011013 RepID=UPI000BB72CC3|nr:hypothetical protein [Evansella halocellulosilytica]
MMKHISKWLLLITGLILFVPSAYYTTLMTIERTHQGNIGSQFVIDSAEMIDPEIEFQLEGGYDIFELEGLEHDYVYTTALAHYGDETIEMTHELLADEVEYRDPRKSKVVPANLKLKLNGEVLDTYEGYDVNVERYYQDQYRDHVSFLEIEDRKEDEEFFAVVIGLSNPIVRKKQRDEGQIYIEGWTPVEEYEYRAFLIEHDGTWTREDFDYDNRTPLQTELARTVSPSGIGHNTDALHYYPTYFFPFLYPYGSTLIGLVMIIIGFPRRKRD